MRGENIRAELLARLAAEGPQKATDLLPKVVTANVSLAEVAFQLDRLADEGDAVGETGDAYRVA